MKWLLFVVSVLAFGCTERNPGRCGDGICIDPARPYCDVDGQLSGEAGTCIAVECEPQTFAACRGDVAVVCSDNGSNYDELQCPLGCDPAASGCRSCTANAQCAGETPICDATASNCRGCIADDECESRVCDRDTGACVDESSVVYAAAENPAGTCSKTQPCSLPNAILAVRNSLVTPVLRILPGTYTTPVSIDFAKPDVIRVVASGASVTTIGNQHAIDVTNGAKVAIRGIASTSQRHIKCGDDAAPISELTVEDATFTSAGSDTAGAITRCTVKLHRVKMSLTGGAFVLGFSDPVLEMDQSHLFGNGFHGLDVLNGTRARVRITNSLLVNVYPREAFPENNGPPGNTFQLAYATLLASSPQQLCKDQAVPRMARIENSIIASLSSTDAMEPITNFELCTFTNTILYPYTVLPPVNTIIDDPDFVNVGLRDFHLKPTSPAVDKADTANSFIAPSADLEGRARPIGPAADLGAYEHAP